jgi:hypothetical protein
MRWRIILLMIGLAACSSEDKPQNLIEEGTMINVMTDIHMLEAEINSLRLQHQDSSVYIYQKLKIKLLKKYNLDTAAFNASFKYYITNPDKMKPVYVEVKKKLEDIKKKTMEASQKKPSTRPTPKPNVSDSMRKIVVFPKGLKPKIQ